MINEIPEKIKKFLLEEGFDLTKTVKRFDTKTFIESYDIHHKKFGRNLMVQFIPKVYKDLTAIHKINGIDELLIETYKEHIIQIKNSLEFKYFLIKKRFTQNKVNKTCL